MSDLVLMIAGGIVTRFFNQPINEEVLAWTADTLPANWAALRNTWWGWHQLRTGLSVLAMALRRPCGAVAENGQGSIAVGDAI